MPKLHFFWKDYSNLFLAQKSPELLTLAETLQRRKQYRSSYGFLRTKCLDDIETAVDEDQSEIAPVNAKTVPINDRKTENGWFLNQFFVI